MSKRHDNNKLPKYESSKLSKLVNRKLKKCEKEINGRMFGSVLQISEVSSASGNWSWRLTRRREMRLHWDKWDGNDESSYVKSMK